MEQQFTVELTMNKKHHREFGYLHINRRKSWIIRFVLIILLMLLLICTALFTAHINKFLLFSTVLYYFYWLFADLYYGSLSYHNANKKAHNIPVRLTFTEDYFISESDISSGTSRYDGFLDVMEGPNIFALYVSRASAVVVPKDCFTEGTVDDFREFLTRKIGPVRRVQPSGKQRIWGSVLGVAFVLAMVGSLFLNKAWNSRLVRYDRTPYHICLPAYFEVYEDENYHFTAYSDEVTVYTYSESQKDLHSYGIYNIETLEDYVDNFVYDYSIVDYTTTTLENGTICLTYTEEYNDFSYFYCDAITKSGDTFWITEFYCAGSEKDEYEPQFLKWAKTIEIAE